MEIKDIEKKMVNDLYREAEVDLKCRIRAVWDAKKKLNDAQDDVNRFNADNWVRNITG